METSSLDFNTLNVAAARYRTRTPERKEAIKRIREEGVLAVEAPNRVVTRMGSLGLPNEHALERVLGTDDLLQLHYLETGFESARSVCRIQVLTAAGNPANYGTGFMVSSSLLITNNHVLRSKADATRGIADFNFEREKSGGMKPAKTFRLDPNRFFYTNEALDFSLVAVAMTAIDNTPLSEFGQLKLIADPGKALLTEFVTIVQHPNGLHKFIALRNNRVLDIFDSFAHYETDTQPGSSGSPVFNDQWQVAFLHHSGVPRRDTQGRYLNKDGRLWREEQGNNAIDWVANEGVRISSIVSHLRSRLDWTDVQREMIEAAIVDIEDGN